MPSENGHRASKAPPATGAFCHTQARPILIGCAARRGWTHGADSQWERSPSPEVSQVEGGGSCLALLAEVSVQLSLGYALFLAYFLFYTPVLAHLHTSWPYCGPDRHALQARVQQQQCTVSKFNLCCSLRSTTQGLGFAFSQPPKA